MDAISLAHLSDEQRKALQAETDVLVACGNCHKPYLLSELLSDSHCCPSYYSLAPAAPQPSFPERLLSHFSSKAKEVGCA